VLTGPYEKYLQERNQAMKLKRQREEINLAVTRDVLIERALVVRQLAYFLIAFRQAVLAIPTKLRSEIGGEFTHEMFETARRIAVDTLEHLSRLPEAVDADWQEQLEAEEEK
jgi:hypothetical protein